MSGPYQVDSRLLAQSYDPSNTGFVSLQNRDPKLGGPKVSPQALANALSRDQVVISKGAILAQKPGATTVPGSMEAVALAKKTLTDYGYVAQPLQQYQYIDANGYPQTEWHAAIKDIGNRLREIGMTAARQHDPQSQQIANMVQQALADNQWHVQTNSQSHCTFSGGWSGGRHGGSVAGTSDCTSAQWVGPEGDGAAANAFAQLYGVVQTIAQNSPDLPTDTMWTLVDKINGANKSVEQLRKDETDPRYSGLQTRAEKFLKTADKGSALQKALWAIGPGNDSGYGPAPGEAFDSVTQDLATLRSSSADPAQLQKQLEQLAQQAYKVEQDSWNVRNADQAANLADEANSLEGTADQIQSTASGTSTPIEDLYNYVPN